MQNLGFAFFGLVYIREVVIEKEMYPKVSERSGGTASVLAGGDLLLTFTAGCIRMCVSCSRNRFCSELQATELSA